MVEIAQLLGTPLIEKDVRFVAHDHPNVALTRDAVPWHTEKVYTNSPPAYLLLGCGQNNATGGRTLLLDGERAANTLRTRDPDIQEVVLRYSKDDVSGSWPLIQRHPRTKKPVLWYRQDHPERRSHMTAIHLPPSWPLEGIIKLVDETLQAIGPTYVHAWTPGDVVVIDNYRMLHAREAYTGERTLKRILVTTESGVTNKRTV